MFFGPPSSWTRNYSDLYSSDNSSISTIRAIFHWHSHETCGDSMSSHALLSAYLHAENKALLKSLKKKKSNTPSSNPKLQIESVPAGGTSLITIINEDCKRAFEVATSGWTDLQAPIITNELYESWIAIAKVQYAYLWFSMASFCGITVFRYDEYR